jgi:AhpD family alkylhydroperoxidase
MTTSADPTRARQRVSTRIWSDVGPVGSAISALSGRVAKTEPPKLFLALGRRAGLLVGWLVFASRLMPRGGLPRRDTEIVILRVASLTGCDYERSHHETIGRSAGLSREEVTAAIDASAAGVTWSPREQAILAAVGELHDEHDLQDATYDELARHLSDTEIVELLMLVGHYQMLAQLITTLRITPDESRKAAAAVEG